MKENIKKECLGSSGHKVQILRGRKFGTAWTN